MKQLPLPHIDEMMLKEVGRLDATYKRRMGLDHTDTLFIFQVEEGVRVEVKYGRQYSEEKGHWVEVPMPIFLFDFIPDEKVSIVFLKE